MMTVTNLHKIYEPRMQKHSCETIVINTKDLEQDLNKLNPHKGQDYIHCNSQSEWKHI